MSWLEAEFDVIVVGGGHAGTEAAVAAARLGARVALVTSALETIGQMSCNPAIGGVAKGTVVREVDALGGIMGRATDRATLQFRMLNRSKGPAVWAPRAQCDRGLYRRAVRTLLERHANLLTIQGTVARLIMDDGRAAGVETLEGRRFGARAVVITTGTFLRGRIHIGTTTQIGGGRAGEAPTTHLAEQLEAAGLTVARFKTGTPPRIDGRSVDFTRVEKQESELGAFAYRWSHFEDPGLEPLTQLPCFITHLEDAGKEIIATHIGESAMYGGAIASRGPRYCPSVEDKIVKFPEAARHQLFLEPEGLETTEMYVNGLSTSLPAEVQLRTLRTVRGLEQVRMTRAGYAIEYDYYPPTQLGLTFQVRAVPGLYFAGQINGTTGYEEAAGQGVLAGLNAGLAALGRGEPLVLGRETSYLGVLADDIVTRGVDEPYRLFTSRSEFRLTVRQDNALRRLAPVAERLGLYDAPERAAVARRMEREDALTETARRTTIRPEQAAALVERSGTAPLSHALKVAELVRRPGIGLAELLAAAGAPIDEGGEALVTAELELKYAGYYVRERRAAEKLQRMGGFALAAELPYETMRSLTIEARQKLSAQRPMTLAQAARIPGVTPADLQNLVIEVERWRRASGPRGLVGQQG
ncbi:tRNA uridine 5-carboxymethylaminomethyl modification enzyme mnmG [Gemmatirosa kalamazoonensis]|uniref:tRNA uridine 5-carboxymethylaminomethyl modification enzyme MnmG n=1 Tax=Gemmatirosa kalamazoonensis TaxID=861299 RepID=W0REG1_9BACT|nr:tRNA uridine-5-carboxymethylaminomethyl(34) synthesis enzyme MnmG [Gemmatirosa kalamazoonensis]AHG88700.1 tRNA uridine 5-carboxymethylaminomethyl modification enzyme mnmG [Gemmatirosa kalamazoonensis]